MASEEGSGLSRRSSRCGRAGRKHMQAGARSLATALKAAGVRASCRLARLSPSCTPTSLLSAPALLSTIPWILPRYTLRPRHPPPLALPPSLPVPIRSPRAFLRRLRSSRTIYSQPQCRRPRPRPRPTRTRTRLFPSLIRAPRLALRHRLTRLRSHPSRPPDPPRTDLAPTTQPPPPPRPSPLPSHLHPSSPRSPRPPPPLAIWTRSSSPCTSTNSTPFRAAQLPPRP